MRERIEQLRKLLTNDGSIWITIDDNECHYLKVVCDQIFGRSNFVTSMVWEKDSGRKNDTDISSSHDYVLVYAKSREVWRKTRNTLVRTEAQLGRYQNPDSDPRGPWRQGADGTAKSGGESLRYPITLPSGRVVTPPSGNFWRFSRSTFEVARSEDRVYFGKNGDGLPVIKKYLSEIRDGVIPKTWWPAEEVGSNQEARRDHLRKLLPDIEPFPTPKPERLLHRILLIASNPGDIVLDSFGGSGTTAAVAHKTGRKWITVELNAHCTTHLIPRLRKVIEHEDPYGVTDATDWTGGGGFRFYRLAPSLLERDKWGNLVINRQYNAQMLAEALCKLEGYAFSPDGTHYWKHGQANDASFLYVTNQTLTEPQLHDISAQVGPERSLRVLCGAWQGRSDQWPNLVLKKIPATVLKQCEWDRDDYSLNVGNVNPEAGPPAPPETEGDTDRSAVGPPPKRGRGRPKGSGNKPSPQQVSLLRAAKAGGEE